MIVTLALVIALAAPHLGVSQERAPEPHHRRLSDEVGLAMMNVELDFMAREFAMRRKELAKEQSFLKDAAEFERLAQDLATYRYAPSSVSWASTAVKERALQLGEKVDLMIRFLTDDQRYEVSTRFENEGLDVKLSALAALTDRIEFRLEAMVASDVVDVSGFQQLVQDLVIVKGLCAELRAD